MKKYISSTVLNDFNKVIELAQSLECGIEISRFPLKHITTEFEADLKRYAQMLQGFGGPMSVHGFFTNLNPASKDPDIKEISQKRYNQSFEIARKIGADVVVFHTCYNNLLKHSEFQRMFYKKTVEFYADFIKKFEKEGITAVIENVHEPLPDWIIGLVDEVDSKNLKISIDFGHVNLHGAICPISWLEKVGQRLHHCHFHNNFKNEDSHSSIKAGNVDYEAVLSKMDKLNLSPKIVFEIFKEAELVESVKYFNELLRKVKGV